MLCFCNNLIFSPDLVNHPDYTLIINQIVRLSNLPSVVVDTSRRGDQLIKGFMTVSKTALYRPIKDVEVRIGPKYRKRPKKDTIAIIQQLYFQNDFEMATSWFGSGLKHGLTNPMIDWLLGPTGSVLFDKITDPVHLSNLLEMMEIQTVADIQTNLLERLRYPTIRNSLIKKIKSTKLPWSYVCNILSCLYFYQQVLNRMLLQCQRRKNGDCSVHPSDESQTSMSCTSKLVALRKIVAMLQTRLTETPAGKNTLEKLGLSNNTGFWRLPKYAPVCFLVQQAFH